MAALLNGDMLGPGMLGVPQWGIFNLDGSPTIQADSVYDMDYQRDYHISDYPQEQGAFMSYNKVKVPFDSEVGFLCNQSRYQILNTMESICASLSLVAVVTPEVSYPSANIIGYRLRRASREGVTLVLVIVKVKEIRIVSAGMTSNTQSTNGATPTQSGQVQAQIPPQPGAASPTTNTNLSVSPDLQNVSGSLGLPNVGPVNPALPPLPPPTP